jgi:hypothetical protein
MLPFVFRRGASVALSDVVSGDDPVPAAPTFLVATGSGSSQTLSWVAPELLADGSAISIAPVTSYDWYLSTTSGQAIPGGSLLNSGSVSAGTLSVVVSGLPAGSVYATVRANNASGASEVSHETELEV